MGNLWKRMKGTLFFVPKYGFYGAPHYGCGRVDEEAGTCPTPIDWMDKAFKAHDDRLLSDAQLAQVLKEGDVNQLYAIRTNQDWSEQLKAKFYRGLALNWLSMQAKLLPFIEKIRVSK